MKKRKYIDSAPTEDWNLTKEIEGAKAKEHDKERQAREFLASEARVPPSVRARAEELERRGPDSGATVRKLSRLELVRRLIAQQSRMGWVDPDYERELEDLECRDGDGH